MQLSSNTAAVKYLKIMQIGQELQLRSSNSFAQESLEFSRNGAKKKKKKHPENGSSISENEALAKAKNMNLKSLRLEK